MSNEINESTKKSLKTRVISALVGLVVIIPPIILGDWFMVALVLAVVIIGLFEMIHCGKKEGSFWLYFVTILIGVLMVNWPIIQSFMSGTVHPHAYEYFPSLNLPLVLIFVGICMLFLIVILHTNFTVKDGCFIIAMVLLISLGLQSVLYVRFFPSFINQEPRSGYFNLFDSFGSSTLFLYGILGTFMTDIGAYFIGVFFGKHKINERISPKKTYEGFFGGIVISALISMTFAFVLALVKHPILPGVFDLEHWYNIVVMSLLMPFLATLGDFVFSAVKRFYDIKDFGNVIPGHGGILDRIDSIVFVFAGLALYTSLFYGIANGAL